MKKDNMPQVAQFWNDIAHDFDAIYTGDKKSGFARTLDHWLRKDIYQRFDWVMERSRDIRPATVCDVGCGSGRFVAPLAKRGAEVTGIDVAPEMLKLAEQLTLKEGVRERCRFIHTDILNWKPDQNFDLVIAIGFWDYIQDPAERLRIIRSMTTKRFLSAWPRYWTWRMPIRKVRLGVLGCPVYFFRRSQIEQLLKEAGFRVDSFKTVGKLFCVESTPV
jgi:SAM-dependent methyltransferase